MFVPADPRFDEMLLLARRAMSGGLRDTDRPRWRQLVLALLGELRDQGRIHERRVQLRASMILPVLIRSPAPLVSATTSNIGSGGLALVVREVVPAGTLLELSIELPEREPLQARALVVYSRLGELGAAFIDLFQHDREYVEAVAAQALLARTALE